MICQWLLGPSQMVRPLGILEDLMTNRLHHQMSQLIVTKKKKKCQIAVIQLKTQTS